MLFTNFHPNPPPLAPGNLDLFGTSDFVTSKRCPSPPNSDLLMENVNNFWDFGFGHIKYHLFSQNRTFSFCGDFTVSKIKWIMFLIFSSTWLKETKGFVTLVGFKLLTTLSMTHSWILGFLGQKIENLKMTNQWYHQFVIFGKFVTSLVQKLKILGKTDL